MNQFIELLVTIGFLGAMLWGMLKFLLRDIHRDLSDIKKDITNIRGDISELKQSQQRSEARIDHLYEENNRLYHILIDLVQKK